MTAQIPDLLFIRGQSFSIVGVNGEGMFEPQALNLQPVPRITSCWRGYVCEYRLHLDRFLLSRLRINLGGQEAVAIHGVGPGPGNGQGLFSHVYEGLDLPVGFDGGLLAGSGFIQELYVHMGFQPAWKYQTVLELVVSQGHVIETRDVSKQMEGIRLQRIHAPLQPDAGATTEQITDWVASTFRRDYRL